MASRKIEQTMRIFAVIEAIWRSASAGPPVWSIESRSGRSARTKTYAMIAMTITFTIDLATLNSLIEEASRALAEVTKCAIVSTNETSKFSVITKVELIPTGKRMYVLLLITSSGDIKN